MKRAVHETVVSGFRPIAAEETLPPLCVDVERAAQLLGGVSPHSVRLWIQNGQLPVVKLPAVRRRNESSRRVLIAVADLKVFVARHTERAGG
jgi:hypothetical protein